MHFLKNPVNAMCASIILALTSASAAVAAPPIPDSKPVVRVAAGAQYSYKLIASDDDGDTLTWSYPTITGGNPNWLSLDTSLTSETIAGRAGFSGSTDGTGANARFEQPYGFDIDANGALIIADWQNDAIRKLELVETVNSDGSIASNWVTSTIYQYSSAAAPKDVVVGPDGNYYVAEYGEDTIDVIDRDTGLRTVFAGQQGTSGSATGNRLTAATFKNPNSLDFDSAGNMYVADRSNHCIRKIDVATNLVSNFAGLCGSSGTQAGTGSAARFWQPVGVAVDSNDNIFIAQRANGTGSGRLGSERGAVMKITQSGVVTIVAGGPTNVGSTQLMHPYDIYIDGFDNIYVAGWDSNRIHKIEPDGTETILAGSASEGSSDTTGAITFNDPIGVAVDRNGFVFVADHNNHTMRRLEFGARLIGTAPTSPGKHLIKTQVTDGSTTVDHAYILEVYDPNSVPHFVNPKGITFSDATKSIAYSDTNTFRAIKSADVDFDGDIDFISTSFENGNVVLSLNDGSGTFNDTNLPFDGGYVLDRSGSSANLGQSLQAIDAFVIDLDQDADKDVVLVTNNGKLIHYINNGSEVFTRQEITTTGIKGAISVAAGYIDSDNDIDIVIASNTDNQITWFEQSISASTGVVSFVREVLVVDSAIPGPIQDMTLVDLDDDGDNDIVFATKGTLAQDDIFILTNNGTSDPTFTKRTLVDEGTQLESFEIADIDSDGDLDIVSVSESANHLMVSLQSRSGGFLTYTSSSVDATLTSATSLAIVDSDLDNDLDIVVASKTDDKVYEYVNNGSTSFSRREILNINEPSYLHAADFDGDGAADIIFNNGGETVSGSSGTHIQVIRAQAPSTTIEYVENGSGTIAVNASDRDGSISAPIALTYAIDSGADSGKFTINTTTGALSFVSSPDFESPLDADGDNGYEVAVKVRETSNSSSFAVMTHTVNVTNQNEAPSATLDATASTPNNQSVALNFTTSDPDTDSVSASILTGGTNGSASVVGSTIVYTPDSGYVGTDAITVRFADGNGGTVDKSATITVTVSNVAPVATVPAAQTVLEDTAGVLNFSVNDADNDTVSVSLSTSPNNGNAVIGPNTVTYTPNANVFGSDSYTLLFDDGNGGTQSKTVSVTITPVNDAPTAVVPSSQTTLEDTANTISFTTADIESDMVTASVSAQASKGVVTLASGTVSYQPNADQTGSDSYNLTFSDGNGGTVVKTVSVTITPVNDAPVVVIPATQVTNEDTANNISFTTSDADADTVTITISAQPTNGTISISGGSITYVPEENYAGNDSYTLTFSDGNGAELVKTVAVSVTSVNDLPTAEVPATLTTNEDESGEIDFTYDTTDVDGDTIAVSIASAPSSGAAVISGTSISYTPAANFNGNDTFSVKFDDGNGGILVKAVAVDVTPVNDAPVISVTQSLVTSGTQPVTTVFTYTDVDGDTVTADSVSAPANGGLIIDGSDIIYQANANYSGTDTFRLTFTDGQGASESKDFTVVVNTDMDQDGIPDDQDPDIDGDGTPNAEDAFPNDPFEDTDTDGDGTGNNRDNDDDGDGIVDSLDDFPTDSTRSGDTDGDGIDDQDDDDIDGDGISNSNDPDANGDGIEDEGALNSPPVANNDVVNTEDIAGLLIDALANDTDINGDNLTILSATTKVGSVTFTSSDVTYQPEENFNGSVIVKYTISDGKGETDSADILINVNTVDEAGFAPVVIPPEDVLVNATALFTKVDLGVAVATDDNGNPLPVSLVDGVTFFEPGVNTAYWEAIDEQGLRTVTSQQVLVRPLVSFAKDQVVKEGEQVTVVLHLNGTAPSYPLDVSYAVDMSGVGSANNDDHSLRSGTITFDSGTQASVTFPTIQDEITEGNETIVIRLSGEVNSIDDTQHVVTIIEGNEAPQISLSARQQGDTRFTLAKDAGPVTLVASAKGSEGETFTYTWETSNDITDTDAVQKSFSFDPINLALGTYSFAVEVASDDPNTPLAKDSIDLVFVDSLQILDANTDSDGDNVSDAQEGYNDTDRDGIPDFADSIAEENVIPQIAGEEDGFLMEGEPGVSLRVGATNVSESVKGALIDSEIVGADEVVLNTGGLYDFEIRNIPVIGQAVSVVLPQQRAIPNDAIYRKYDAQNGWYDFVEDSFNGVSSAAGELGFCPPPNADVWTEGLTAGHYCVRITLQDGGPNDADAEANGRIVDPGGVGIAIFVNELPQAQDDSATMLFNTSLEIDVLANDTDADGDLLTIVAAQSDFGDVLIQGGKLIFTPLADYFGDVAINYSIDDGFGVLDSARVNVNVFVNTAPITIDDSAATDDETPILIDVLANDYDDEGNSFSLVSVTSADIGAVLEDQQIRFTPTTGFAGAVQITYMVEDIYGAQREGILTITVTPAVEVVRVRNTNENSSGGSLNIYLFAMLCMGAWYRRFTGRRYLNNTKPQTFKKFSDYE